MSELTDSEMLEWIRKNCKVIYYPAIRSVTEGIPYPIEHTMEADKDTWWLLKDYAYDSRFGL